MNLRPRRYAFCSDKSTLSWAARVLECAVAPQTLARRAETTGGLPGRRSAVELAAPRLPFLSQSAEILERAVTRPKIPLYPRVSLQLQTMLEAAQRGGSIPPRPTPMPPS